MFVTKNMVTVGVPDTLLSGKEFRLPLVAIIRRLIRWLFFAACSGCDLVCQVLPHHPLQFIQQPPHNKLFGADLIDFRSQLLK